MQQEYADAPQVAHAGPLGGVGTLAALKMPVSGSALREGVLLGRL
jgi:hypothetical protein